MEGTKPSYEALLARHQALMDALLLRFKNCVELAPMPPNATKEVVAAQAFQMNVECSALIRATQDLLMITRELKVLWLAGPIRNLGEGEENPQMDIDSKNVAEMVENLVKSAQGLALGKEKSLEKMKDQKENIINSNGKAKEVSI